MGTGSYANGMHIYGWRQPLRLVIGNWCSIGDNVTMMVGGEHSTDRVSTSTQIDLMTGEAAHRTYAKGPIVIGHDVWIGHGATVLSGVTVGNGAVIGAGAVVAGDVEPYGIVGGVPAKLIRRRVDKETADRLEQIAWWEWSEEVVRQRAADFADIDAFVAKYGL